MARKLTRRERAAGLTKGPSPSGYTTPADVARDREQWEAEQRRRAESAKRNRVARSPLRPSTAQLMSAISMLTARGS